MKLTINTVESLPQKKKIDLSQLPVAQVAQATRNYHEDCKSVSPDIRAAEFYALNHLYLIVNTRFTLNEPLPDWASAVTASYNSVLVEQSERMMHYLLLIITREARHLKHPSTTLLTKIKSIAGEPMIDFLAAIRSKGESEAINRLMKNPPDVKLGPYVRALEYVFHKGSWAHQFGGKLWGVIAQTLGDMIYGKTSLEMMVDTAYTLAHNTSPIFNKGMMYEHHGSQFIMILDVQRAGQMVEFVREWSAYVTKGAPMGLVDLIKEVWQYVEAEFLPAVNWEKVQGAGAKGSYHHLFPKEFPKEQEQQATLKAAAKAKKEQEEKITKGFHKVGVYQIDPDYTAVEIERD